MNALSFNISTHLLISAYSCQASAFSILPLFHTNNTQSLTQNVCSPGPVFTKILILRISLILRIFLRIVIFLRKILRIRIFLFTKILILRITFILRIFQRMVFILRIFLRIRIFYSQRFLFLEYSKN